MVDLSAKKLEKKHNRPFINLVIMAWWLQLLLRVGGGVGELAMSGVTCSAVPATFSLLAMIPVTSFPG